MKTKILLIISIVSILFLSSCKKEDTQSNPIVGRWNVTEFNSSGTWETVSPGEMYSQFNDDGTYISKFNSSKYTGTWSEDGDIVTCNVSGVYVTYKILQMSNNKGTFEVKEPGYKPYSVKATRQ